MIALDRRLRIGALVFNEMDQIDLAGPFEVLSRLPNTEFRLYGRSADPVRDQKGLRIVPDAAIADAPTLDVLLVPGGFGQEALMDDEPVLHWVRTQAASASFVFSVCTGALICGAAGLLRERHATTHWASVALLPFFGAVPVHRRVVRDGRFLFAAGVTAGIDGALALAALLRGDAVAQAIQLYMQYAPEPPFDAGTPDRAPSAIALAVRNEMAPVLQARQATARRIARRLGIPAGDEPAGC